MPRACPVELHDDPLHASLKLAWMPRFCVVELHVRSYIASEREDSTGRARGIFVF